MSFFIVTKNAEYKRNNRYGKIWKRVFKRDVNCRICGSSNDLCIDHIIPVSKGGKSTLENLRVLCRSCNVIEGHAGRDLDPRLEKRRNYAREWVKTHLGYFTEKSREFRLTHQGYYRLTNQKQYRLYRDSQII